VTVWRPLRVWLARQGRRPPAVAIRNLLERATQELFDAVVDLDARSPRRDGQRHVALVGHNVLMAQSALRAWACVADDPRLRARLFMPWTLRHVGKQLAREASIPFTPGLAWSRLHAWDLVIVATHVKPYHPAVPVVRMLHGIGSSSKIVRGHEFTYRPTRVIRPDGKSLYASILESSEATAEEVVRRLPVLAGHVVVTGSLAADELLARQTEARSIRPEMGIRPAEHVVVMMSTFGPSSLMETVGRPLMEQMRRLTDARRYRFVVCTHPNLWSSRRGSRSAWGEFLRRQGQHGLIILEPTDDWVRALAAADAAISDHTSLAVAFALLGKPLAFVPVSEPALEVNSSISRLMSVSPVFVETANLGLFLDNLFAAGPTIHAREIAAEIVSCPGQAIARTTAELHRLLVLDGPVPQITSSILSEERRQ
jgi:hypothetical protein